MKTTTVPLPLRLLLLVSLSVSLLVSSQFAPPPNRVLQKSAYCDNNFIHFSISFEQPFRGVIYSEHSYGIDRCTYVNGSIFSSSAYNITVPLADCRTQTLPNGTRSNVLTIQRDPRILESTDTQYIVTCNPQSPGAAANDFNFDGQFTVTFAGLSVQATLASTEVVINSGSGVAKGVDYSVEVQLGEGPNGQRVNRVLNIGEPIAYVVRVRNQRDFDARVGRCWATDDNSQIQLSDDNGCSLQRGGNVWNNFQTQVAPDGSKVFYNNMKAWAFPTSTRVNIFCNLHTRRGQWPASACSSQVAFRDVQLPVENPSGNSSALPDWFLNKISITRTNRDANRFDQSPTVPATTEADVVAMRSGFEVEAVASRSNEAAAVRRDTPGLITAGPTVVEAGQHHSADSVCIAKPQFIVAVCVCLLLVFISVVVIVYLVVYRMRRAKRSSTGSSPTSFNNSPPHWGSLASSNQNTMGRRNS